MCFLRRVPRISGFHGSAQKLALRLGTMPSIVSIGHATNMGNDCSHSAQSAKSRQLLHGIRRLAGPDLVTRWTIFRRIGTGAR
jgi:hypothetical protein